MSKIGERLQVRAQERSGMVSAGETRGVGQSERELPRLDSRGLDAIARIHFEDGVDVGHASGVKSATAAAQLQQRFAVQNVASEVVMAMTEELVRSVRGVASQLPARATRAQMAEAYIAAVYVVVADAEQLVAEIRGGHVNL
jgi:uncharacterized protein YaaW (UPF0174 family)